MIFIYLQINRIKKMEIIHVKTCLIIIVPIKSDNICDFKRELTYGGK